MLKIAAIKLSHARVSAMVIVSKLRNASVLLRSEAPTGSCHPRIAAYARGNEAIAVNNPNVDVACSRLASLFEAGHSHSFKKSKARIALISAMKVRTPQ